MAIGPHTQAWGTTLTTPVVGDPANQAHLDMQEKARDIGERFDTEHDLNVSTTDDGRHAQGSARVGIGATASRPPNRSTTAHEGPSQGAAGGNEAGRLYFDTTRLALQVASTTNAWVDIIPQGLVAIWSGTVGTVPAGWGLCDGGGGRVDLRGRFVARYDAAVGGYNNPPTDTGGANTVTLTIAEMPSHRHEIAQNEDNVSVPAATDEVHSTRGMGVVVPNATTAITLTGGGGAHENRPPYRVLCYIQKL